MVNGVGVSRDLEWLLTRNWSSHQLKRRGIGRRLSKDPLNPKGLFTPRFQGTIQRKALTVEPHSSGKGVVLRYKKKRHQQNPSKSVARVELNKDSRRTLQTIRRFCNKNLYRTDLKNVWISVQMMINTIYLNIFMFRFACEERVPFCEVNVREPRENGDREVVRKKLNKPYGELLLCLWLM